jgi:hypothetical protein
MSQARPAPLDLLRECQDRELRTEGIPMVLALVSEIGPVPDAVDEGLRSDGHDLAQAVDHYREALVPTARDTDMGCAISVLQAVSYEDFGRDVRHGSGDGPEVTFGAFEAGPA